MKIYHIQFSRFPYYEHLQIAHMFNTMHIRKNVAETLWWILDLRSDKEKIVKICNDIQESNHVKKDAIQLHRNKVKININSLSWLLMEQQSNFVKEVIQKIKFPIGFCSNMKNIITKKGDFAGVKTRDWHVFIKVIIIVYILLYFFILMHIIVGIFSTFLRKIMKQFLYYYSMFYLYLHQETSTTLSNNLYMILENTWGKWWYIPCIKLLNSW